MNILFVQSNTNRALMPLPIGPAMVAHRLLNDGHHVRFLDLMGEAAPEERLLEAAREHQPDLVCCTIRNRDNQWMRRYHDPLPEIRDLLRALRSVSTAPLLLGGTAFTTFPARMLDFLEADFGIAGDNLDNISRFVRSLANGSPDRQTPGLVHRENGVIHRNPFAIAGYPHVDFGFHRYIERERYKRCYWDEVVITRCGCPERCAYCDTHVTFGRDFILRDVEDVVDEMQYLKQERGARSVFLVDAGFNRPLDHAKRILETMIQRKLSLQLYGIVDPGPTDAEFYRLFRRAGGVGFTMFAESLADPVLAALGKSFTASDVFRDAALMRKAGVGFMFMPTFGSPGETRDTVRETLRLAPSLRALFVECGIGWRIQPDTPLRLRAIEEGLVDEADDLWDAKFYISPETPVEWLEQQLRRFRWTHPFLWAPIVPFLLKRGLQRQRVNAM